MFHSTEIKVNNVIRDSLIDSKERSQLTKSNLQTKVMTLEQKLFNRRICGLISNRHHERKGIYYVPFWSNKKQSLSHMGMPFHLPSLASGMSVWISEFYISMYGNYLENYKY